MKRFKIDDTNTGIIKYCQREFNLNNLIVP